MREILTYSMITGFLFIVFLATLIYGLVRKQRLFVFLSLAILFVVIGFAGWTGYKLASNTYHTVTEIFKPRTGDDIYKALFGKPVNNCLRVLNYQDQVVPKVDYAIWLHFATCAGEIDRVLNGNDYTMEKLPAKDLHIDSPSANDNWFKPETLGDSVLVFKHKKDESGNGQTIYLSIDSTIAYCIDIQD